MALNNVTKKIDKSRNKLGLGPDEQVLGACMTDPKSGVGAAAGGLVGVALQAALNKSNSTAVGEGMASAWPKGRHLLGITSSRVIVCGMSAMTGKPTTVVASWNHADITGFVIEKAKLTYPFAITFSDASIATGEGAKGTGADQLASVLAGIWR